MSRSIGYGPDANYMVPRRWDYFVRYLAEGVPPHEYQMKPSPPVPPEAGEGGNADEDPEEMQP